MSNDSIPIKGCLSYMNSLVNPWASTMQLYKDVIYNSSDNSFQDHDYKRLVPLYAVSRGGIAFVATAIGLSMLVIGILMMRGVSIPDGLKNATLIQALGAVPIMGVGGVIVAGGLGYTMLFSVRVLKDNPHKVFFRSKGS